MILNQVTVMGNLVRDPELKYTPAGAAICNMRMAVNDGYYKEAEWTSTPVFIDVAVFGDKGVTAGNLRKGERVIVVGKLRYEEWEGRDGNKRSAIKIAAFKVSDAITIEKPDRDIDTSVAQPETDDDSNQEHTGSQDDLPF